MHSCVVVASLIRSHDRDVLLGMTPVVSGAHMLMYWAPRPNGLASPHPLNAKLCILEQNVSFSGPHKELVIRYCSFLDPCGNH